LKSKIHLSEFENAFRSFWQRQHVDFVFEVKIHLSELYIYNSFDRLASFFDRLASFFVCSNNDATYFGCFADA
jgi:hypothetical protein